MNYLAHYQSFTNKQAFNEALALHIDHHQHELNETDRDILLFLSRHAIKYPGVAHMKVATIMKQVPKHTRTIRRSLTKLEQFHILKKQPVLRAKSGGHGANLYIFLPFDQTLKTTFTKIEKTEEAVVLNRHLEPEPITHYTRFFSLVSSYIGKNDKKTIDKLYGIFSQQASKLMQFSIHEDKGALFEGLALEAVAILFQTMKRKKIHNLFSYYDGIYRELINRELFSDAFLDYEVEVAFLLPHEM